ncbi:MAG: RNA polymerase factor sigma-54 [Syntrophomonadaceae bacterium]|nr:RNA polymerase factor sigma-54 [Syntrophomonadaceae bacterium]
MRLGLGLNVEQVQRLIMTPELRQAITVLQLSAIELHQYLQKELQENPFLEVQEENEGYNEAAASDSSFDTGETGEKFDIDWQEYFSDRSDLGYVRQPREEYPAYSFENFLTEGPSLQEHLQVQLDLAFTEGREREIGQYLLGCLDDYGYLRVPLGEIAAKLECSEAELEQVLSVLQTFDPTGVGARGLCECLLLQLKQLDQLNALTEKVVREHLDDVARGRWNRIASSLNISIQEVQSIVDLIRQLNPRPGDQFSRLNEIRYVAPDVFVERIDDEFVVLLNDTLVPRLGINNQYRSLLMGQQVNEQEARKFLENKLNAATWLIRSLEQRRYTLYRVACCLVEFQREFLLHGVKRLRPLTLKQVAEKLGIHESTVSRATANKYLQSPQGVHEFKFFFSSGISDEQGMGISAPSIQKLIREIVESEDISRPFSDQQITEILNKQGIPISRRTVAKYRSEIGIPSTAKRKRY